jgi:hypothetical protein
MIDTLSRSFSVFTQVIRFIANECFRNPLLTRFSNLLAVGTNIAATV